MRKFVIYLSFVAMMLLATSVGFGIDRVFQGHGSDQLWSNPANWDTPGYSGPGSGSGVPAAGDTIILIDRHNWGTTGPRGTINLNSVTEMVGEIRAGAYGGHPCSWTNGPAAVMNSSGSLFLPYEKVSHGTDKAWLDNYGTINAGGQLSIGRATSGQFTMYGGQASFSTLIMGENLDDLYNPGTSELNLYGGTVTLRDAGSEIMGDSVVNITYGTLIAADDGTFETNLNALNADGKIVAHGGVGGTINIVTGNNAILGDYVEISATSALDPSPSLGELVYAGDVLLEWNHLDPDPNTSDPITYTLTTYDYSALYDGPAGLVNPSFEDAEDDPNGWKRVGMNGNIVPSDDATDGDNYYTMWLAGAMQMNVVTIADNTDYVFEVDYRDGKLDKFGELDEDSKLSPFNVSIYVDDEIVVTDVYTSGDNITGGVWATCSVTWNSGTGNAGKGLGIGFANSGDGTADNAVVKVNGTPVTEYTSGGKSTTLVENYAPTVLVLDESPVGDRGSYLLEDVADGEIIYWSVDYTESTVIESGMLQFTATDNFAPYDLVAGPDAITWVGAPGTITLSGSYSDDGISPVNVSWTTSSDSVTLSGQIDDAIAGTSSIVIATALATEAAIPAIITMSLDDGANSPVTYLVNVFVYADACDAARDYEGSPAEADNPHDIDNNCVINLVDFATLAEEWMLNITLSVPEQI